MDGYASKVEMHMTEQKSSTVLHSCTPSTNLTTPHNEKTIVEQWSDVRPFEDSLLMGVSTKMPSVCDGLQQSHLKFAEADLWETLLAVDLENEDESGWTGAPAPKVRATVAPRGSPLMGAFEPAKRAGS